MFTNFWNRVLSAMLFIAPISVLSAVPVSDRPTATRTLQAPSITNDVAFQELRRALTPAPQAQSAVFAYLTKKTGQPSSAPAYPVNGLLTWSLRRYEDAPDKPKALYILVTEDLLIAKHLLCRCAQLEGEHHRFNGIKIKQWDKLCKF